MRVRSPDTDPDAEKVQVALLREADATRRLALAISLTDTVHDLARRAIRRARGAADETDVRLQFLEFHHGRELADAVRLRLSRRRE